MHPVQCETDDTRRIFRPEQGDGIELAQFIARLPHQGDLMGMDRRDAHGLDVIYRRTSPIASMIAGVPASKRCGGGA